MKAKLLIGITIALMSISCGNNSEEKKDNVEIKNNAEVISEEKKNKQRRSLEDSAANQIMDLFGMKGDGFNDLFQLDSLENQAKQLMTEEGFKKLLVSEDFSKEEIDALFEAYKKKDSLDAQLTIAKKRGATKAELEAMMEEHKATLKRISPNPEQIDLLYSFVSADRLDDALNTIGKDPINIEQAQVREKLDLDEETYVEEKLTKFSMYGESKRKETMKALKSATKAESNAIVAEHFGITVPEVDLIKKLPSTPKILSEDQAIGLRDYEPDPAITKYLASGKASARFKLMVKQFTEQRQLKSKAFLKKATKARDEFYKLNPGWYGENETSGITYIDARNQQIYLPLGELSFADAVVSHDKGKNNLGSNEQGAIGEPDMTDDRFSGADPKICNLGLSGVLTLEFKDNAIVDVNGPDLYVFELGAIEPTNLELSKDGKQWILVGKIDGGTAFVDIKDFVTPGETYNYIRLTDLESHSALPGADVDAVAAIGGAVRLNIDSSVLFDTGKFELKESAASELKKLVAAIDAIPKGTIVVEGHTDNVGSPQSNQALSLKRAKEVSSFLQKNVSGKYDFEQKGLGESRPVVPNDSEENKQKNRRVEILIIPLNN